MTHHTMSEHEAYPELPDYDARTRQQFSIGDRVRVGPAYAGNGQYRDDGETGVRYVVRAWDDGTNFRIAREPGGPYLCTVHVSRLVPAT